MKSCRFQAIIRRASRHVAFLIVATVLLHVVFDMEKASAQLCGQLSGQVFKQDFNTLSTSGSSNTVVPLSTAFTESGMDSNITYAADNGSSATNNTYSYGSTGSTERAFGGLGGATVQTTVGACFVNNTGFVMPSFSVAYTGEEWRLGFEDGTIDRLDFQFSTNAQSLTTGTWTDVNTLDFATPNNVGGGTKDGNAAANRTTFPSTAIIPAAGIPAGGVFFIRWVPLDIPGNEDGLAIDDLTITYSPMADFNLDGAVDGADLLSLQRNFGMTSGASISQGDANKDGAVDALDMLIWRSEFNAPPSPGSGSAASGVVPEPASLMLAVLSAMCFAGRARSASDLQHDQSASVGRAMFMIALHRATCVTLLFAMAFLVTSSRPAAAQTNVSITLDIFPNSNANPNAGGTWAIYAKTDSAIGIVGINMFMTGINTTGISYGAGINAALDGGNPYVATGSPIGLLYFQDVSQSGVVLGVGTPSLSSGPDPLGNPAFDGATKIATGSYNGAQPAFATSGSLVTDANLLSTSSPPFNNSVDANTTFVARTAISGDYNLSGQVNAADYVTWRNNLGSATSLRNDNTPGVGPDDYARWRANFNQPAGSGSVVSGVVPEPSTLALVSLIFAAVSLRRRT